jgi:hypothetical protein
MMRMALVAAALFACTAAVAQTAPSGSANTNMAPNTQGQPVAMPPPAGAGDSGRTAAMNSNAPPVTPNPNPDAGLAKTPASGANSFTLGQARTRIAAHGFTQVASLHKDRHGIWWATAMHDGRKVQAWLDYKGNVGLR